MPLNGNYAIILSINITFMALQSLSQGLLNPDDISTGLLKTFNPIDLSGIPDDLQHLIINVLLSHGFGYMRDGIFYMIQGYPNLIPTLRRIISVNAIINPDKLFTLIMKEILLICDSRVSPLKRVTGQQRAIMNDEISLINEWLKDYLINKSYPSKLIYSLREVSELTEDQLDLILISVQNFFINESDSALFELSVKLKQIKEVYLQSGVAFQLANFDGILISALRSTVVPLISEFTNEDIEGITEVIASYLEVSHVTHQIIRSVITPKES
jgi:hypothetical protein